MIMRNPHKEFHSTDLVWLIRRRSILKEQTASWLISKGGISSLTWVQWPRTRISTMGWITPTLRKIISIAITEISVTPRPTKLKHLDSTKWRRGLSKWWKRRRNCKISRRFNNSIRTRVNLWTIASWAITQTFQILLAIINSWTRSEGNNPKHRINRTRESSISMMKRVRTSQCSKKYFHRETMSLAVAMHSKTWARIKVGLWLTTYPSPAKNSHKILLSWSSRISKWPANGARQVRAS